MTNPGAQTSPFFVLPKLGAGEPSQVGKLRIVEDEIPLR